MSSVSEKQASENQPSSSQTSSPNGVRDTGFAALGLNPKLLDAVLDAGYETPTPIQAQAIPVALRGKDLFGAAQTGTGKTAAFVLPILQRLLEKPTQGGKRKVRALVLSPTRELAAQIGECFATLGRHSGLRQAVVFGGVGQGPQVEALRRGIDVLVAAPGRLSDLMDQGLVELDAVEVFVLDEADRMLDQGFLPAVRRILNKVPARRQTLFFSATMPAELEPLAKQILKDPERIEVARVASTPARVVEALYHVEQADKRFLLSHLLEDPTITRAVVFTRTKHGADRVARHLEKTKVRCGAIHGNKSQNARERALGGFKDGSLRILVATDVAARGIDIDGVSHVINFDLPMDAEAYVHRIGRTARAGAAGKAMSFCCGEERERLLRIEKLIRRRVPVAEVSSSVLRGLRSADDSEHRSPLQESAAGTRERAAQHQRSAEQRRAQPRPGQRDNAQGRPTQQRPPRGERAQGAQQGRPAQGRSSEGRPAEGRSEQGRSEQGRPAQARSAPHQGRPAQQPGRAADHRAPHGSDARARQTPGRGPRPTV